MTLPLEGIVVVDLTRLLPGPFATQLFANLGAEVIKVEEPLTGDYMRFVPPTMGETSYPFLMVNRNKKSIAVNLKEPDGQAILHKLVARADVFVEQFRAGVAERLGADPETLRRVNPKLVYCTFEGFGRSGPYAGRPAPDIDFGALSGILGGPWALLQRIRDKGPSLAIDRSGRIEVLGATRPTPRTPRTRREPVPG